MDETWPSFLCDWFIAHKRPLPWRQPPISAYRIWISEIMLQQTQVTTVVPYFIDFMRKFPDLASLASADQQEVLKQWEGLGYYTRARNMHKASKEACAQCGGRLPESAKALQKLSGIGPYTAAAIASIAFGEPIPVVDGNVLRVITRLNGWEEDIRQPATRNLVFEWLSPRIQPHSPANFNEGLMELGALVCTPQSPNCHECPLFPFCNAYKEKKTDTIPYKSPRAQTPHHHVAIGIIERDNKILIAQRPENTMLGGLWELPGGKQKTGESITQTLHREIAEETGLELSIRKKLQCVKHAYTHFKVTLHPFICSISSGTETAYASQQIRWISPKEIPQYPFPKGTHKIFSQVYEYP